MAKALLPLNPWAERFRKLLELSDDELTKLLTRTATPMLVDLSKLPPATAESMLRSNLKQIYIPTRQAIDIIRRILGRAQAHALLHYPTMEAFVRRIYEEHLEVEPSLAIAITGIAGVGKTQMIDALLRLLSTPEVLILPDGSSMPFIPAARLTVGNKATDKAQRAELLRQLGASRDEQSQRQISPAMLARRSYVAGCCQLLMDEIQFKAASNANAALTKGLLAYTHIGPPFSYLANFSLISKLLTRNHEDQERLLSNVIVVQPEDPDSGNLRDTVMQFNRASGGLLDLDPERTAERLDFLSGGSRRAQVDLVLLGALMKWESGKSGTRAVVRLEDLEEASRAEAYAARRETARLLLQQRATGRIADKKRPDLWCPIKSAWEPLCRVTAKKAEDAHRQELVEAALRSQIPLAEQRGQEHDARPSSAAADQETKGSQKRRPTRPSLDYLLSRVKTGGA